ncbi:MAG: hypothetical protein V4535_09520 [Bacteroidota bacterium]
MKRKSFTFVISFLLYTGLFALSFWIFDIEKFGVVLLKQSAFIGLMMSLADMFLLDKLRQRK